MERFIVDQKEKKDRWMDTILSTLKELPAAERDVFVLYQYHSFSLSEISAKLALSLQEVEKLLKAAQARLFKNLKPLRRTAAV